MLSTEKTKKVKNFVGIVSSAKNDKTITVVVESIKTHPLYHKKYRSSKKYHAHDETNSAKVGDKVTIINCRPYSALKRFRLIKILDSQNKN